MDDFADRGVGAATHQGGDRVHGDGWDKDQKSARGDSGAGQGDDDARKSAKRTRSKVVGGLDERIVEFFNTGVDGENHEGEVVVDEAQHNCEGGVHHANGGGDDMGGEKQAVRESLLT